MPLMVTKPEGNFTIAPEGSHVAVITEVKDLGVVETNFGPKEKVRIKWEIAQRDGEGRRISAIQQFTKSLHEKSSLYKALKSILGREPGKSFDLETLVSTNAQIVVTHTEKEGKTYSNIAAILKVPAGTPVLPAKDSGSGGAITAKNPITDADVAFA